LLATLLASKPPGKLLFFAPERILLEQVIRLVPRSSIVTTDLNSADVDAPFEDIQHLSFTNAAFAMIICNHVLEHVIDDGAAITECARILVPGGICVFTIPGDFDRVPTRPIEPPDGNGHHRHYGMDILERLRGTFCTVEALDMSAASPVQVHVRRFDYAFICRT
jgi:SAM-dependent methyltransferase